MHILKQMHKLVHTVERFINNCIGYHLISIKIVTLHFVLEENDSRDATSGLNLNNTMWCFSSNFIVHSLLSVVLLWPRCYMAQRLRLSVYLCLSNHTHTDTRTDTHKHTQIWNLQYLLTLPLFLPISVFISLFISLQTRSASEHCQKPAYNTQISALIPPKAFINLTKLTLTDTNNSTVLKRLKAWSEITEILGVTWSLMLLFLGYAVKTTRRCSGRRTLIDLVFVDKEIHITCHIQC